MVMLTAPIVELYRSNVIYHVYHVRLIFPRTTPTSLNRHCSKQGT